MTYQFSVDGSVVLDGVRIPSDPGNRDWLAYLEWASVPGNVAAPYVAPPEPVPQIVSRFQGRQALRDAGQFDAVQAFIDRPETPAIVRAAWDEVQQFERTSLVIMSVAVVLSWTAQEVDAMFVAASRIEV